MKEGKEIGREEGREQERKETIEKLRQIAKKLKKQKMPTKQISEITGLSKEEIEDLK